MPSESASAAAAVAAGGAQQRGTSAPPNGAGRHCPVESASDVRLCRSSLRLPVVPKGRRRLRGSQRPKRAPMVQPVRAKSALTRSSVTLGRS